jgi:hypothetical protein
MPILGRVDSIIEPSIGLTERKWWGMLFPKYPGDNTFELSLAGIGLQSLAWNHYRQ